MQSTQVFSGGSADWLPLSTSTGGLQVVFDLENPRVEERRQAPNEAGTSNVTPSAITSNWFALRKLSPKLLASVYEAASYAESKKATGHPGMHPKALKAFITVFEGVSDIAVTPTLSVTPKGYIVSEWYLDPDNSLDLMFDGKGTVFYSLFDNGAPCEGFEPEDDDCQYPNLLRMFRSRDPNPFSWSDL